MSWNRIGTGIMCAATLLTAACSSTSAGGPATGSAAPTVLAPSTTATASGDPTTTIADPAPGAAGSALAALAALPVKGRAPKTGYSREQFGQSWADVDRNGCDTRSDVLLASLVAIQQSGRCTVVSGTLNDPYTGTSIHYQRGASQVDIDHVVALSNAWQTGAFQFPFAKRVALANDPLNLVAVDASTNRQKGDGDAATWLPPNKAYRCEYVARQVAVKAKYQLWVTPPEAAAIEGILKACPGQRLPDPGPQPTLAANTGGLPEPAATTGAPAQPRNAGPVTYYRVCADAEAAGVTPIRRGTALYDANRHLDRDGDGVACE